ncbi:PKD domain-containing protein [Algoriphagus persicinus]|uniref:PKD domain-containing protein n=1 Tax=Algoriphagus persicinus TaxID=3108754 RepID=UPI002B383390|nr:PKD domain-containing protein [Algoriphagus sp. E1-3-M2]MEB2784436.1 PKD domain-containing protein [Algoriphagus sp. E1-3-M2]
MSEWVEKDVTPPANTNYQLVDGQVIVPTTALKRAGIQPIVRLNANGNNRTEVGIGKQVNFTAAIEVPPQSGEVISAEWDFEGEGTFPVQGKLITDEKNPSQVTLNSNHIYTKPKTYFVTLRVASQREGDAETPYTKIKNLGRVRVVVE